MRQIISPIIFMATRGRRPMKNESAENIVAIGSLLAKCGVPNLLHPIRQAHPENEG